MINGTAPRHMRRLEMRAQAEVCRKAAEILRKSGARPAATPAHAAAFELSAVYLAQLAGELDKAANE